MSDAALQAHSLTRDDCNVQGVGHVIFCLLEKEILPDPLLYQEATSPPPSASSASPPLLCRRPPPASNTSSCSSSPPAPISPSPHAINHPDWHKTDPPIKIEKAESIDLSFHMGLSKTEVNLRRLLAAAPQQKNHAKLVHYVTTLREQLEQLGAETTSEGIPSISKAKLNEYSEKIEALAAKLAAPEPAPAEVVDGTSAEEGPRMEQTVGSVSPPELRRRFVARKDNTHEITERDSATPVKLDASAQAHIEKHRKLQEDLTDEMVVLARQLKESSLMMNQSIHDTEKILDSTEKAVEHSLASTDRANVRAMKIYTESSKTTCFTWLLLFAMTCIFVMVVLLIRVT